MNLSKNHLLDIICFIIGPVLIAYNLLDFTSRRWLYIGPSDNGTDFLYYYYDQHTQLLFSIGVALVCWGFLRIYWKKNN